MTFRDFFGDLDLLRRLNASSMAADLVLTCLSPHPTLSASMPDIASASFLEVGRCGFFHLPLPHSAKYIPFRGPLKSGGGVLSPSLLIRLIPSSRLRPYRISAAFVPSSRAVEGAEAVVVKPKSKHSSQRRKRVIFSLGIGLGADGIVLAGGWMFAVGVAAAAFLAALSWIEVGGLPPG